MRFIVTPAHAGQREIVTRFERHISRPDDATARDGQIISGEDFHRIGAQFAALNGLFIDRIAGGGSGFRHPAVTADHLMPLVELAFVEHALNVDIARCAQRQRTVGFNRRAARVDVIPRRQRNAAGPANAAGVMIRTALFQGIVGIPDKVIAAGGGDGIQIQIPPGNQLCGAIFSAGNHLCAGQRNIAPGLQSQLAVVALDVDPGHAVYRGPDKAVFTVNAFRTVDGAGDVDIAPRGGQQVTAADDSASDVIDIGPGIQTHIRCLQNTGLVGYVIGINLQDFAPGDGPAVKQVAIEFHRHIVPGNECAGAINIALFYFGVDLRHQYGLHRAVRHFDAGIHQPDDISGQERHLLRRQSHAQLQ